jgi:CofD-related protein of GAK system
LSPPVRITHALTLPDALRVERCRHAPEYGPRILFFTGGSALRSTCRRLKLLTHNSIHLITPFDSGGSSAVFREHFDMLSVGDVRSRLIALADETVRGNPQIYALFSHRLPTDAAPALLRDELERLASGQHPLVAGIPEPLRYIARRHIESFCARMPDAFDLRGTSIGNLVLAGGYLDSGTDIDSVVYLFSHLVAVRGTVCPITQSNLHLAADLRDGTRVVGQHRITGKIVPPIQSPITELYLVHGLDDPRPASVAISNEVRDLLAQAELICYPHGSFYTSIVANLLPRGVGRAIHASSAPKVYIPNLGTDPEQFGMSVLDCVEVIRRQVSRDAGAEIPVTGVLDFVLVDAEHADYGDRLDVAALRGLGLQVIDLRLMREDERQRLDPERLAEILVSMV